MIQGNQNLFQGFSTSIDQNQQLSQSVQQQIHERPTRKQKRSATYTKQVNKNLSLDPSQLQDYNLQLHKSFHMFKKCVSSEEIFYGKTTEEELYRLLYDYLCEVIEKPQILSSQIISMCFQQGNKNENNFNKNTQQKTINMLQSLQMSNSKAYSHLSRIFTQNNLAKSVSIQFDRSIINNSSGGVKNSSGVSLGKKNSYSAMSLGKEMEEEYVSRAIASIQEVQSEKMQDSVKYISDSMRLIDIKQQQSIISEQINVQSQQEDCIIDSPSQRKQIQVSIKMMDNQYIQNRRKSKNINISIKMMNNQSSNYKKQNNISIKMMDNSSDKKMDNLSENDRKMEQSSTSFGFDFDTSLGKDLLQQVSLMYLNNHSLKNQHSQVSLSIRDSVGGDSSWFSETSSDTMSLEDVSQRINIQLTLQFLTKLYYEPQPFLVTISLIYLLKYLYHSAHIMTELSAPILLATSLLVSYKIYEDQPIAGLVQYLVDDVLEKKLTRDEMVKFQRHFLQVIGYEVVIGNQQFYKMLAIVKGEAVIR